MIDEAKARAAVEDMNKRALNNLLKALAVEKYMAQVFTGGEIDISYSPAMGTLVVHALAWRTKTLVNLVEAIKTAVHAKPKAASYFGGKGDGRTGARLLFEDDFIVMIIKAG